MSAQTRKLSYDDFERTLLSRPMMARPTALLSERSAISISSSTFRGVDGGPRCIFTRLHRLYVLEFRG